MMSLRARVAIAVLAVAGSAITAAAIVHHPRTALLGYLAAYATVTTTAMGVLVLLLVGYATNARWLATMRRLQEAATSVFPLLAVLFLPIALGQRWIYVWADPPDDLPARVRDAIAAKQAWLQPSAFIVRAVLYFAVFIVAAELLRRWSVRREVVTPTGDPELANQRERVFAAAMLPPVGLALTFASIDWMMTLEPTWVSSMFPVYIFAGGFVAGIAVLSIVAARCALPLGLTPHHFHALGRMLFAFVVFWGYAAYFQGFLIQIANRPSEVAFFVKRTQDGWARVLDVVVATRFVLPFFLLLPRELKMRPRYVAAIAAVVLVGHALDLTWVVIPSGDVSAPWFELPALAGITGICIAFAAWRMRGVPLVPAADPFHAAGLRYESPT
jgi:hypothetical protein